MTFILDRNLVHMPVAVTECMYTIEIGRQALGLSFVNARLNFVFVYRYFPPNLRPSFIHT
jgi:hypothetical protein